MLASDVEELPMPLIHTLGSNSKEVTTLKDKISDELEADASPKSNNRIGPTRKENEGSSFTLA